MHVLVRMTQLVIVSQSRFRNTVATSSVTVNADVCTRMRRSPCLLRYVTAHWTYTSDPTNSELSSAWSSYTLGKPVASPRVIPPYLPNQTARPHRPPHRGVAHRIVVSPTASWCGSVVCVPGWRRRICLSPMQRRAQACRRSARTSPCTRRLEGPCCTAPSSTRPVRTPGRTARTTVTATRTAASITGDWRLQEQRRGGKGK